MGKNSIFGKNVVANTVHSKRQVCLGWTPQDCCLCLYVNLSLLLPQIPLSQSPGPQGTPSELLVGVLLLPHGKLSWTYWSPHLTARDQGSLSGHPQCPACAWHIGLEYMYVCCMSGRMNDSTFQLLLITSPWCWCSYPHHTDEETEP